MHPVYKHRLGEGLLEDGNDLTPLPWLIIGTSAGVALYFLIRASQEAKSPADRRMPGQTRAEEVPPMAPPSRFATLESVDLRFGQLQELYRMGYKTPEETLAELDMLALAAQRFPEQAEDVRALEHRIETFKAEVEEFLRTTRPVLMTGREIHRPNGSGSGFPVLNLSRRSP